ncbi:MAG: MFS transporter [Chloroflexi bacterium]|nr:MFS transporter [Chloroflexota bacterium]
MVASVAALRRAIPLPPRRLWPALGGSAAIDGMTGIVVLSAGNSYLLRTLGAAAVLPALALTLHALVKLTVSPVAGRILDRRRADAVLPAVPILAGAGLATMLTTQSIGGYLAGLAALTAGTSTAWVLLRHSVGNTTTSADRGNVTAWISLASGAAAAAGFGAGTLLAGVAPRAAFIVALALAIAAALLLRLAHRAPMAHGTEAAHHAADTTAGPPRRIESMTLGLVAAGQFALAGGLLVAFWPLVLRELDFGLFQLVVLLVPAGGITLGVLIAVARWSRSGRRLTEVTTLFAIGAAGLALAAWSQNAFTFGIAMAAVIPAQAAGTSVVAAAVIDFSRAHRGPAGALGWLGAAEAAGSLVGSALTGIAISAVGARGAFAALAAMAAALACAAILSWHLTAQPRPSRLPAQ